MRIDIPHKVEYDLKHRATVADVIASLEGAEALLKEAAQLVHVLEPNIQIEAVYVHITEVSQNSPLRDAFITTIVLAFQRDLTKEVPKLFTSLTGIPISADYDTLFTMLFCVLAIYGVDFAFKGVNKIADRLVINAVYENLVADIAKETGKTTEEIRSKIEGQYPITKGKALLRSSLKFFQPSKNGFNAGITVQDRRLEPRLIAAVPSKAQIDEREETSQHTLSDVVIELHAQDVDRRKTGWAAVIPEVSPNRVRMEMFGPIKLDDVYTKQSVRGDVVVRSKMINSGTLQPVLYTLVRLTP